MNIAICGGRISDAQNIIELINRIEPYTHNIVFVPISKMHDNIVNGKHFDLFFCGIDTIPTSLLLIQMLHTTFPHSLIVIVADSGAYFLEYSECIWRYETKPMSFPKIKHILARAKMLLAPQTIALPIIGHERLFLNLYNIVYFEIYNKTGVVHTTDHKEFSFRLALNKVESNIEMAGFFKPHKSYLVNIQHIKYISKSTITMVDDACIPLSRNRKNDLFKLLSKHTDIIFA